MDASLRRQALRRLTYGVHVVTAGDTGATITWIAQASMRPPLVMVAIRADSRLHAEIARRATFAVNTLANDQRKIAQDFFDPRDGRLDGHAAQPGAATGAPILAEAPSWLEARVVESVARGDHTVFVAEVVNAGVRDPAQRPLVLAETGWSYGG